jgi:protein gp37
MGQTTGIEWSDATWNPWMGCRKVSPACAHCYAERDMTRYGRNFNVVTRAKDATFNAPMKWQEPRRIFTCSWSDFFIEESDAWRHDAWQVVYETPRHTYQILTKRPERVMQLYPFGDWRGISRIWWGATVENARFYRRIEDLQRIPAAMRFLSLEPLLGPMPDLPLDGIQWVIVGGESGAGFRPLNLDWVREIRDRCMESGVKFFFKQKSAFQPKNLDRLLDGREWNELPVLA